MLHRTEVNMCIIDPNQVRDRRELFFRKVREFVPTVLNADGSGKIPQFNPPWREVFWITPALYRGGDDDIKLANRMIGRYFTAPLASSNEVKECVGGKVFNIFLSTISAGLLNEFDSLLSPEAREVLTWHTEQVFKTFAGAGQPDVKFHGCNDNMPMMATKGLIIGGQKLHNEYAYHQGVWNLNEFRRLLSRSAWASEFNSSTYSPITIANLAQIAEHAEDPAVAKLARDCEERLWAEVLLHFHPGIKRSGGPNCRSYAVDLAGHPHSLQALFWLIFGEVISGYDIIASFFAENPDPLQVIPFCGNIMQNVAEMSDLLNPEFHIPPHLAELAVNRSYPAVTKGRSESMMRFNGMSGEYNTYSYMEEEFSLGTVDTPLGNGNQTTQLYATYKLRPKVMNYRDSGSVFYRCFASEVDMEALKKSHDGGSCSEPGTPSHGWHYTMQHNNCAVMLSIVEPKIAPLTTPRIELDVIFPVHYGRILSSIIGTQSKRAGAVGESSEVAPVSIEAGEVFIHIQGLLPTDYPRRAAVRFIGGQRYERLALINYEGEPRTFSTEELALMQNGFVFTIDAKHKWHSLEDFHRHYSDSLIMDYTIAGHRFFRFIRHGHSFETCYTPAEFGVQTAAINGRNIAKLVFDSNQLNISTLPFTTGEVAENAPFWAWGDSMEMHHYPGMPWLIGARGLPDEAPYSRCRSHKPDSNT